MDPSAILNVVLTAALAGVAALWKASNDRRRELETRLHESKRAEYEKYVKLLQLVSTRTKAGNSESTPAMLETLGCFAL